MTIQRNPVSAIQNAWFDLEDVDDSDLTLEQNFNATVTTGIINNQFGSGVLPNSLTPAVLFNSSLVNGLLDGKALNVQAQPSDANLGNQLSVELSGSQVVGNRTVKVLVVGLDFQNNLQYDRFTFHINETQYTRKHYKTILTVVFNDLLGAQTQSLNLGGTIVISEAAQFILSRDCIMIAQDTQPNLFFRDFFVASGGTLQNLLTTALPSYNIANLNIMTGFLQLQSLLQNDVSSQVGQKFLASTNNIQKITLLMAVMPNSGSQSLVWDGDLLVSVYPLQTTVACSTDVTPNLAIDFDPSNIPLVQLSYSYASLLAQGIELNTIPQPVDFIFSNNAIAAGSAIVPGNYYAITVKRAGTADSCQIQFAIGANYATNTMETIFNGSIWTDIPEQSLWFQVWTDAAKVSDGQAYENGIGLVIPKTIVTPLTQTTIDYSLNQLPFTLNSLYYAWVQATIQQSNPVQDERTGNTVLSQKQYVPTISLINQLALNNIPVNIANPLLIGTIKDENIKSVNSTPLLYNFHEYGMVDNQFVIKVITNQNDGYRYDTSIIELVSEVVEGNLSSATIIPNTANQSLAYKIVESELITMTYGDANGDGIVDQNDIAIAQSLIGYNLNYMPTYAQYITDTTYFINVTGVVWEILNGAIVVASGTDGIINVNPLDGTKANFNSVSANFMSITDIGNFNMVINGQVANPGNNGVFTITALVDNNDITIQKQYYTSDKILQVMRCDIDQDMVITANDVELITNFVQLIPPFPPTSSPANNIGTTFQAIRLTVEELADRQDDYPSLTANRATTIHPLPSPYLDGYGSFGGQDLMTIPLQFSITERLDWQNYNVLSNANPRMVSASFTNQSGGLNTNSCSIEGIVDDVFPMVPSFDPGKNDFFIPNNLIIGNGQILNEDGYSFSLDYETATIIIEIPNTSFDESIINVFTDFVANYSGTGFTRLGSPAMKFSDCSFVSTSAILNNQIRFNVAARSFSPQIFGLDISCASGIIVDPKIGISFDSSSGNLTLNFSNLYQDPIKQTLNTKVEVTVHLKKGGFRNKDIYVNSSKTFNLLGIVDGYGNISDGWSDGYVCPDVTVTIVS